MGSAWRCTQVTTSSTVWFSRSGTVIGLVAAVGLAAPERDLDRARPSPPHLTVTCTRCTALLPKPPVSQRGSSGCVSPLASVARQAQLVLARLRVPRRSASRARQTCPAARPARPCCHAPSMPTSTLGDRHAGARPGAAVQRDWARLHHAAARIPVGDAGRHQQRFDPHVRDRRASGRRARSGTCRCRPAGSRRRACPAPRCG